MRRLSSPAAALAPNTYLPISIVARGHKIRLYLHFDESGGFWVDSPDMSGLVTQGENTEEAISNGVDAALALLEAEEKIRKRSPK